jgi:flagellar motor protein MotB
MKALGSRFGFDSAPSGRSASIGQGQTMPIADNATEYGQARNERVDFQITGLAGREFTTDHAGRIFR